MHREIIIVWRRIVNPKERGCIRNIKIKDKIHLVIIIDSKISGNSLFKILILEIKDRIFLFPEVLKV